MRSLKPLISDETVYNDRRSCPNVFREELLGIDCRVDDVERFYHHLKPVDVEEKFPTIAHTPGIATASGGKVLHLGGTGYNPRTVTLEYKEGTKFEGRGRGERPSFKNHCPLLHQRVHRTSPLRGTHCDHLYYSALLRLAKPDVSPPLLAVPSSPSVFCKPRP